MKLWLRISLPILTVGYESESILSEALVPSSLPLPPTMLTQNKVLLTLEATSEQTHVAPKRTETLPFCVFETAKEHPDLSEVFMNKHYGMKAILTLMVLSVLCEPHSTAFATPRITPELDVQYLGSFKVPHDDLFAWSGFGLTYYPNGNAGRGSLFLVRGDTNVNPYTCELSIPAPVRSNNPSNLNTATVLQSFKDITRISSSQVVNQIGDICYLPKQGGQTTDKLYYSGWNFYNVENFDYNSIGWAELTLSTPNSQGMWHVGGSDENLANRVGKYLFAADKSWADTYLQGRYLLTGMIRGGGNLSSQGPTLYAIAPWEAGNPPSPGASLPMTRLLQYNTNYPYDLSTFPNFSTLDRWRSGAWITADGKHAVLLVGQKGKGSNNQECYGEAAHCNDPCNNWKGYHDYPYSARFIWYDVDELAAVATGRKSPAAVTPYSIWTPTAFLWNPGPGCTDGLGGAAYDSDNHTLYVVELGAESTQYAGYPIIHAFKVNGTGAGTSIPSEPTGLTVK
jgi:hypothetical protein